MNTGNHNGTLVRSFLSFALRHMYPSVREKEKKIYTSDKKNISGKINHLFLCGSKTVENYRGLVSLTPPLVSCKEQKAKNANLLLTRGEGREKSLSKFSYSPCYSIIENFCFSSTFCGSAAKVD